jgi:glycosyltransferase involved in cell wall biosynthesis
MISIVIASYNHAHYLPIMLASIIRQGPVVSRIIVVNDGSTDNTADVLAKIKINEPRLIIKNLTKNVGWLKAQHIGLSYVNTEFFAFNAADDFIMPGWADKSLNALKSLPEIGMCFSPTFVINENSESLTKALFPKNLRGAILSPKDFHLSVMRYGSWMESNGMLIRKSVYDERCGEFGAAGAFADGLTMYVLGLKAGVILLDDPLTVFFERDTSVSGVTVSPSVGKTYLLGLSKLLKSVPCVELVDSQLSSRILQRNTYMYLMSSIQHLTAEFVQISEKILPSFLSRALKLLLLLLFNFYRLVAFAFLRPFDFILFRERLSHETTSDEKKIINEYRKVLIGTLPSIGLDI